MSSRSDLLTTMVDLWKSRPKYHVNRGPVNWATFDFDSHEFAIAIMQERGDFGELFGQMDNGSFAWEIFGKVSQAQIDDNHIDHLIADAKGVIREMWSRVNDLGDAIMLKTGSFTWNEISDVNMLVQGVIIQFDVTY